MPFRSASRSTLLAAAGTLLVVAVLGLGTVLISLLGGGEPWEQRLSRFSVAEVTRFIRSTGAWGVAAAIGLMVLHSFVPFPAEFVAVGNGMVYGPVWGTVITWVGAMLGALLADGLARHSPSAIYLVANCLSFADYNHEGVWRWLVTVNGFFSS